MERTGVFTYQVISHINSYKQAVKHIPKLKKCIPHIQKELDFLTDSSLESKIEEWKKQSVKIT
eukprot:UN04260